QVEIIAQVVSVWQLARGQLEVVAPPAHVQDVKCAGGGSLDRRPVDRARPERAAEDEYAQLPLADREVPTRRLAVSPERWDRASGNAIAGSRATLDRKR